MKRHKYQPKICKQSTSWWVKEHLGTGDGEEGGEEGEGLPPLEGLPRGTGLKYFHEGIFFMRGGGYCEKKGRNIFMRGEIFS